MNIYEKLSNIQMNLLRQGIAKSGKNNHLKYDYYELEDLIPPVMRACKEEGVTLYFNFTETEAILYLVSWDQKYGETGVRDDLRMTVPFLKLEQVNRGTNLIQSQGAYFTYLKRYLLMNTFLLTEKDEIDSEDDTKTGETPKKNTNEDVKHPEKIKNCIRLAKKNGGVTAANVKKQADELLRRGVITSQQVAEIKKFVDENGWNH